MELHAYKSQLITLGHVTLLFAVVAVFRGVFVAVIFVLAGLLGYLNAFAGFRSFLAVIRGRHVSRATTALVALAAFGSVAFAWLGYWPALAICTLSFLVIDAVALRFSGPPIGTLSGAP